MVNMKSAFASALSFNQEIKDWDTSRLRAWNPCSATPRHSIKTLEVGCKSSNELEFDILRVHFV